MTLRYEDLCADPPGTLSRIYSFAGLPSGDGVLEFRGAEHHVIGNRMRLASTSEIRFDERWRTVLTPGQLSAIERRVAPLNRKYGYADL